MKYFKKTAIILSLISILYIPICFLIAHIFDLNIKLLFPSAAALIQLAVSVFTLVFSFINKEKTGFVFKILCIALIPLSAINFAIYFIYSSSTAATLLAAISFILLSITAIKNVKFIAFRILIPLGCVTVGIITFVVSLILAIAIGLGAKEVINVEISPSGKYRAELTEQSAIINNGYTVELFSFQEDTRLPFIHIFPDGKTVWSGKLEENYSFFWENNSTLIINGEKITID